MFARCGQILSALDDTLEQLVLRRPLLAMGLVAGLAFAWWGSSATPPPPTPSADGTFGTDGTTSADAATDDAQLRELLTNRPFIDQFPVDPRRTYHIYVFTKEGTGAYITAQNFKQVIELFFYGIEDGNIVYRFPHARLEGRTGFDIKDCRGPGTFDIKLVLQRDPKNDGRSGTYFSWKRYKPRSGLTMPDGSVLDLNALLGGK